MQDCFSTFGLDGTGGGGEDGSCSSGDGSGGIMKICDTGGNSGIIGFGAGGTGSDVWIGGTSEEGVDIEIGAGGGLHE